MFFGKRNGRLILRVLRDGFHLGKDSHLAVLPDLLGPRFLVLVDAVTIEQSLSARGALVLLPLLLQENGEFLLQVVSAVVELIF